MQKEKLEQVIAVTGVRSVFPVRIFLADKTCFLKVLDGSPGGFLGDAEDPWRSVLRWAKPCPRHPGDHKGKCRRASPDGEARHFYTAFRSRTLVHLLYRCADRSTSLLLQLLIDHNFAALGLVGADRRSCAGECIIDCSKDGFLTGIINEYSYNQWWKNSLTKMTGK